jgi:dienelactone hydrolase
VAEALQRAAQIVKRRGMVVVLSDLYEDEDALTQIRRLSRMGHDVIVIHTLAREEMTLGIGGAAEVIDLETGRTLNVQPAAARDAYVLAVERWLSAVQQQLQRDGIDYVRLIAGEPIEAPLRRFLVGRRGAS